MKKNVLIVIGCSLFMACNNNPQPKAMMPGATSKSAVSGEQLYKIKCMQCHLPAKDFAAPALAGVKSRWKNKTLLYEFVRNSAEVIMKDEYAASLFKKWNQSPMMPFPELNNEEIDAILDYCNAYAEQQR